MEFKEIAKKIIRLKEEDLKLRDQLIQNKQLNEGYNEEMANLHNKNAAILNEIINTIGYPTIDKVGKEASEAAWLVIQHSIGQPAFMRKCARLLEQAVKEKRANPINLAYLTDRIAVYEGKPQRYGTHFDWNENGEMAPQPFDELTKVNQRRKSIGLNTLEEQTALMRKRIKNENQPPPADLEKRKRAIEEWKRSVGWTNNNRSMEVFFYGLFMDVSILRQNGINPSNLRDGYLNDYALKIGKRASLIPCKNERAYGVLMTVEKNALQDLYAEASVADYIPEEVNIITQNNDTVKAICYNLPAESLTGTNEAYAYSLYQLAKQLDFPDGYLEKIKKMTKTTNGH